MITPVVQRWRDRRGSYRPAGETINTALYEIAKIPDDTTARAFVCQHHYSGSFPAARWRFGLWTGGALVGVAVFSQPSNDLVLDALPCPRSESTELGRLVLLDSVPANGESWFVARCFALLRDEGVRGIISYSDPMARSDLSGRTVFVGHVGNVYQALNASYNGRGKARTLRLFDDGSVFSDRAASKIRAQDRGHDYAEAILVRAGAKPRGDMEPRAWLASWLPRITRPVKHPGNHRYLFGLDKSTKRALPASLPYPKFNPAA